MVYWRCLKLRSSADKLSFYGMAGQPGRADLLRIVTDYGELKVMHWYKVANYLGRAFTGYSTVQSKAFVVLPTQITWQSRDPDPSHMTPTTVQWFSSTCIAIHLSWWMIIWIDLIRSHLSSASVCWWLWFFFRLVLSSKVVVIHQGVWTSGLELWGLQLGRWRYKRLSDSLPKSRIFRISSFCFVSGWSAKLWSSVPLDLLFGPLLKGHSSP